MEKEERLLKAKDVAYLLDCSPDEVIELARKGKLKGTKGKRFWTFRMQDAAAFRKRAAGKKGPGRP